MTTYAGTTQVNRVGRIGHTSAKKPAFKITETNRKLIIVAAALIMLVFTLVSLSAYTATLQHKNNVMQAENDYLQAEIDAMETQIDDQTKVTSTEKTATEKYGMVYPTADNCITIEDGQKSDSSLASMIKTEAYN